MFVHALSGAASFAACLRLFQSYPLAVNSSIPSIPVPDRPHPVRGQHERDHARVRRAGGAGSIVLWHRGVGGTGCYVLTQDPARRAVTQPRHADSRQGYPVSRTSQPYSASRSGRGCRCPSPPTR